MTGDFCWKILRICKTNSWLLVVGKNKGKISNLSFQRGFKPLNNKKRYQLRLVSFLLLICIFDIYFLVHILNEKCTKNKSQARS